MSNHDPLDTAAQSRSKQDRINRERLDAETEVADIKWLMGNRRGRRLVWGMLVRAGVFQLSFNQNAMQMAFNEGKRSSGNLLLAMVNAICPDLYVVMQQEAKEPKEPKK